MESLDIIFTCLHDDWCKMSSILHIIFRSSPNHVEVQTGIFGCISLYLLYFNHLTHYFPIFVDLESIKISFHKHITLLFIINFIQSLTTWSIIQRCCFWYILSISMHTKNWVKLQHVMAIYVPVIKFASMSSVYLYYQAILIIKAVFLLLSASYLIDLASMIKAKNKYKSWKY